MPDYKIDDRTIISTDDAELTEMINSILEWWDEHRDDDYVVIKGVNNMHYETMYETAPRFVELAQKWSN